MLMFVGKKDEIVPCIHTELLRRAAINTPSTTVHEVADGMHNDTWLKAGPRYVEWLRTFMSEAGKHTPLAPMEAKKEQ